MRFSITAAALVAASTVSANYGYGYAPVNETISSAVYEEPASSSAVYEVPVEYTTTEVVTSYETYCPGPTTIVEGGNTYTVTEATTLTITDCPCTLTKTYSDVEPTKVPVSTKVPVTTGTPGEETPETPETPETSETPETPETPEESSSVAVPVGTGSPAPPATNGTVPAPPATPSEVYEGAANRATVAGGALVGLLGAVVYLL